MVSVIESQAKPWLDELSDNQGELTHNFVFV